MPTTSISALGGTYTIGKEFSFEAAHRLGGLSIDHKCARLHGHSYRVQVVLTAEELTGPGFVTEFGDLAPFAEFLKAALDHRELNEVVPFEPTCEALAAYLAGWIIANLDETVSSRLRAVRVSETASTWAEFAIAGATHG